MIKINGLSLNINKKKIRVPMKISLFFQMCLLTKDFKHLQSFNPF